MKVFLFQNQFAAKVESGEKLQTVRARRKHPVKPGDWLSLRMWSGKPYRSRQMKLRLSVCSKVEEVAIDEYGLLWLNAFPCVDKVADAFARADGFDSYESMLEWFKQTHGLPFVGQVTHWEKISNLKSQISDSPSANICGICG
jgi:hypothetical protein